LSALAEKGWGRKKPAHIDPDTGLERRAIPHPALNLITSNLSWPRLITTARSKARKSEAI
jgi:hypothetical protein